MVGESNQEVFLIQIDASSFVEFEISEFEIARVDCMCLYFQFYTEDSFGLRTLDQQEAIHTYTVPGVKHEQWCQNPIVFEKFILPHLT